MTFEQEIFKKFLDDFNALDQRIRLSHVEDEKRLFLDFQNRFLPFDKKMQELRKSETPFYNIFDVLNVRHRETKLHTPFLVNLLDPKASHEQGSLFLDLFLSSVLKLETSYYEMESFEIWQEYLSPYGQIDILFTFRIENQLKGIVIENKIYAGDQDQQLTRYYTYLTEELKLVDRDILLVYLTTSGRVPSKESMTVELQHSLRELGSLKEIGYYQDIIPWLSNCLPHIKSIQLQQIIIQYIKTLKTL